MHFLFYIGGNSCAPHLCLMRSPERLVPTDNKRPAHPANRRAIILVQYIAQVHIIIVVYPDIPDHGVVVLADQRHSTRNEQLHLHILAVLLMTEIIRYIRPIQTFVLPSSKRDQKYKKGSDRDRSRSHATGTGFISGTRKL